MRNLPRVNFRGLRYLLKRMERQPLINRVQELADHIVQIVTRKNYQGTNSAIAAVYGPLRVCLIAMLLLFFIIFILGALVPIDSAAIAHGTIVVLSNKKTVQHLEGGIIREILVKEGDVVEAGQPLIKLNDVSPKANQTIVQGELYAARVAEARLQALKNGHENFSIAEEILETAKENPDLAKTITTQEDLFTTQQEARTGKLKTLTQRIEQYKEEIIGLEAQVKSANGQLKLVAQEVEPMKRLVKKGFAAKPQLLALQRQQEELQGNRGQYLAAIAKAKQSITETQMQIADMENEFAARNAEELREVQTNITDYEEKLRATSDVAERTTIVAPYEGIVTGLKYHTIGGVIAPATPIMDIIPQSDQLVVEAQISPADIDVVGIGRETKIALSAYKTRNLPRLSGKVATISADTFTAQQGIQNMPYYTARIEVDSNELSRLDTHVKLYPGMPVEVFIQTGSRSFLGYLFDPIVNSFQRAFKED